MGTINEFISEYGYNNNWFVEFVNDTVNQQRIMKVLDIKEYCC